VLSDHKQLSINELQANEGNGRSTHDVVYCIGKCPRQLLHGQYRFQNVFSGAKLWRTPWRISG
jgi:hypothetical protein